MNMLTLRSSSAGSGPIDVRRALEVSSKRHTLRQLENEGRHTVAIVSRARIGELINRAVRARIQELRAADRQRALAPAAPPEKSYRERVEDLAREVESVRKSREALEQSRQSLLRDLAEARKELAEERARATEKREDALDRSPFIAAADVDRHLGAIVTRVCEAQRPGPGAETPPGFQKEWESLETLLRDRVLAMAREERARLKSPAGDPKQLRLMERRIEKLYSDLDAMEHALRLLSTSKVPNHPQVMTALRELGLLTEDKNHQKKRDMLKVVLETNQEVRRRHRALEAQGITLSHPG